jgi:hypothetical protein
MERYSREWYTEIYRELGDGILCYRPTNDYDGLTPDGVLDGCSCCRKNNLLCLLPGEETMFEDVVNDADFRLEDNRVVPGRKTIICSKMGLCNGRKPYVCRTHPVHFVENLMLFEEGLCRLLASTFMALHRTAVERLRRVVYKFGLEKEILGYGRRVDGYVDYER